MKFFVPEWDDRVDAGYDFIHDSHSPNHNTENSHYMWHIFGEDKVPFDGILVSIATIKRNSSKYNAILESGIHEYLRVSKKMDIMADCGAFSYIDKDVPEFTTEEAFEIYAKCGFKYGVSVDHLVVPAFSNQKEKRLSITRKNGLDGLKLWKKKYKNTFQLILAVQGETIEEYMDMYHEFLTAGATHLAFGSLVRKKTDFIQQLIIALIQDIKTSNKKPILIHFFGVARLGLLKYYQELEKTGVAVSFDSASYLRKAWLSSPNTQLNYLSENIDNSYAAIRIPKTKVPKSGITQKIKQQLKLEKLALEQLRGYDKGSVELDDVLKTLHAFNQSHNYNTDLIHIYERTLRDKPWKKCTCPLCQQLGIDVIIFRGNDRNRRRGFHNMHVFYTLLKSGKVDFPISKNEQYKNLSLRSPANIITNLESFKKNENVLVVVGCSKNKIECSIPVPAKTLYQGNVFKLSLAYANLMGYPLNIISAKYGLISDTTEIATYNQVLKTFKDADALRPKVEKKMKILLPKYDKILVIAGEKYRRTLVNVEDERFYYLKTEGIGYLQKVLKESGTHGIQTQLSSYTEEKN